jgi:tetratricopeptide (TPR) repeat protein
MPKAIRNAIASVDKETKRWKMTMAAARMAYESGDFHRAESLLARALEMAHTLPEHAFAEASCEAGIAAAMLAERKNEEAEKQINACIARLDGTADEALQLVLAVALRFRGQAYIGQNKFIEAETDLARSIEICKTLGDPLQQAYSESDLCGLYLLRNEIPKAEALITKVMAKLSNSSSPSDSEYVRANLIYEAVGPMSGETRLDTIESGLQRLQYVYFPKHPNVSRAVHRYLNVLKERGEEERLKEAQRRFANVLS